MEYEKIYICGFVAGGGGVRLLQGFLGGDVLECGEFL